ncbi:hypothetical protein ACIP01_02300 [Pseudomonas monteilii]|uniref:hypothetical protein n=1 Tax=Pseudomonas monteilii TaxID=76759 RepID=UPI00381B97E3
MTSKSNDFEASVAHFKAIADEKLARLRESATFQGFTNEEALEAFAKIDSSTYAGRPIKRKKAY